MLRGVSDPDEGENAAHAPAAVGQRLAVAVVAVCAPRPPWRLGVPQRRSRSAVGKPVSMVEEAMGFPRLPGREQRVRGPRGGLSAGG